MPGRWTEKIQELAKISPESIIISTLEEPFHDLLRIHFE